MELFGIEQALAQGCRMHAFMSGGGLRVVRIEKDDVLVGYGEHPHIEDALSHANEDWSRGHMSYGDVYGKTKPQYLTGSTDTTSPLDAWIRKGSDFDSWREGDKVVVQLEGYADVRTPQDIHDRVRTTGIAEQWEHPRGYVYYTKCTRFANGELGTSTEVLKFRDGGARSGSDPWMYKITKTGYGNDFFEAAANAFDAEEQELMKGTAQ